MKLRKILVILTATDRSETWIVRKNHETRVQTVEMKFLRGVARYTYTDHQRNTEMREKMKGL